MKHFFIIVNVFGIFNKFYKLQYAMIVLVKNKVFRQMRRTLSQLLQLFFG